MIEYLGVQRHGPNVWLEYILFPAPAGRGKLQNNGLVPGGLYGLICDNAKAQSFCTTFCAYSLIGIDSLRVWGIVPRASKCQYVRLRWIQAWRAVVFSRARHLLRSFVRKCGTNQGTSPRSYVVGSRGDGFSFKTFAWSQRTPMPAQWDPVDPRVGRRLHP